jgi:CHAT domain-containing protein
MTAEAIRVRNALSVLMLLALCACRGEQSPSEKLRALASHSGRPIEARLTGFDWPAARLQRATHASLLDPARLDLAGAASTVIQSQLSDLSARARHESGAAYLLIDRDRDAIDALDSAVRQSPNNAAYWSDLAAARFTLAVTENRPHELPQALADADHALRLDSKLHDALFNRALIIEALGISEAARRAWQRYAAADPSSHWSAEALHHLGDLRVVTTRDEFQHRIAAATRALPDTAALIALARNFPQEARTWSEGPLLAKWADAFHKGDSRTATETLTVVRTFGGALGEFNHVQSVADIVATIDRADAAHKKILADAHAIYRDGRVLYKDRRIADAQTKLQEARALFAGTGSPMTFIADYYLANCLLGANKPLEALKTLGALAARVDVNRYPALIAEIGWDESVCHAAVGQWEAAIHNANNSRTVFRRLGESQNCAEMDMLLADDLSLISQPAGAWKARVAAFPVLSQGGSLDRIQISVISAMNADIAQGRLDSALALARVALDELRQTHQPSVVASAEATRAESLSESGQAKAALAAIARARSSAAAVPDAEMRRFTQAAIDIAEGAVVRKDNPAASIQLIDSAISFYAPRYHGVLPKAFLERGRTHVRAGDDDAALADFENGLRGVEAQRSSILDKNLRGAFYDTEPALFSEATELLLRRRNGLRAFEFSDRARARSVYEGRGGTRPANHSKIAEDVQRALPQDSALIEYAILRDSIAIFYISSTEKGFVQIAVTPTAIAAMVQRCSDAIQRRLDLRVAQQASADLFRLLIEPIDSRLAGIRNLIIVPDRELHGVPFPALYDPHRGRYVLDDFNVCVTTNATTVLNANESGALGPVLVVGDPRDGNVVELQDAATEAEAIAAMYPAATLLAGERATRARFIAASRRSGLIHYAGHANSDLFEAAGSLHLAADSAGNSGDLDSASVAALHLQNAPLVILAACGTIRGNPEHMEGMPSIARAFLAAGARNVIGTLWDVDDESAAPLFRRLHQELRNGASPSAALRNAQLALAHGAHGRDRHPATWAPVELLGYTNDGPAIARTRSD